MLGMTEEKRASEDVMVGWHRRCSGHELGQEDQGGLACCSLWGLEESLGLATEQQEELGLSQLLFPGESLF